MESELSEDLQFDDTDLISRHSAVNVQPQKPVESLQQFLQGIINKDSIPKEDLRKVWNIKKSERVKMKKQWNKAKEAVAYWISKTQFLEYQLNRNAEELERMRGRMVADCTSED